MKVYHFVSATLRDGRPVPKDGVWLEHKGRIIPCEYGLHGSEHPFDAMQYAPGSTLCLCDLEGELQPHGDPVDKWVGRRRRIIARRNVDSLLRRVAADEALKVAHLWEMPDVVKRYLTTLDETLREASRAASREASWASWASWAASWEASREASWATREASLAASRASWEASRAASRAASREASWASWAASLATREASLAASRAEFQRRVTAAFAEEERS